MECVFKTFRHCSSYLILKQDSPLLHYVVLYCRASGAHKADVDIQVNRGYRVHQVLMEQEENLARMELQVFKDVKVTREIMETGDYQVLLVKRVMLEHKAQEDL